MNRRRRITPVNQHPILDPAFAAGEVRVHFGEHIDAGRHAIQFGADLLQRALRSADGTVPDLVVTGMVYRHALLAADAALLCLEHGAVAAAHVHTRQIVEASISLDWIEQDRERWARQYYVASLRQQLLWVRRLLPGTREFDAFATERASLSRDTLADPRVQPAELRKEEARVLVLLHDPVYSTINGYFEQVVARTAKPREPNWFQPGPGGVRSLADMASRLGRTVEYSTLYASPSRIVHGWNAQAHVSVADGRVAIWPLRQLEDFPYVYGSSMMAFLGVMRRVLETFRPGERDNFRRLYIERWQRFFMQPPQVTVQYEE